MARNKIMSPLGAPLEFDHLVKFCKPQDLVTPKRLDIIVKVLYAKSYLGNLNRLERKRVEKLYAEHIFLRTRALEPYSIKGSITDYITFFDQTIESLRDEGFSEDEPIIVSSKNQLVLNGAHRLAASIALGVSEVPYREDYVAVGREWDWQWFASTGFSISDLSALAFEWMCTDKKSSAIFIAWPTVKESFEDIQRTLTEKGVVFFSRRFDLRFAIGEFILDVYSHQHGPDLQISQQHIVDKVNRIAPHGSEILIVGLDLGPGLSANHLKAEIRQKFSAKGFSEFDVLHSTDTFNEVQALAEIVFNEKNMQSYLVPNIVSDELCLKLKKCKTVLRDKSISIGDCVIVGGASLDVNLIKTCSDLDIILEPRARRKFNTGKAFKLGECVDVVNANYWRQIPEILREGRTDVASVCNPDNYIIRRGFKFLRFECVVDKKRFSNRRKDVQDLRRVAKHLGLVPDQVVELPAAPDMASSFDSSDLIKTAEEAHLSGDLVSASQCYKRILLSDEDDSQALYGLALCALHRGDLEHSLDLLKRCLEITPESQKAKVAYSYVEFLRST